jgi:ATP-dependent DNA helicase RecQ
MEQFKAILQQYWGYPDFRGIQADIIRSISEKRDTLGLMPTGGGKSITFQVPALSMEGVCLVVTPLIALMKDQVAHLKQRGISAEAIYTGVTPRNIDRILDNAVFGAVKFLYVSPERLSSELFLQKLRRMKLCFITVDEAHCISQWG